MPNPFGTTFETFGNLSSQVLDSVHAGAFQRLCELIDSGESHLISLRAPRAGYGKTMLLSRVRESRREKVTIVPVHLTDGRRVEGERVLEEILTQLTEVVPGKSGLTKLDYHTRSLFAKGLHPLVESGEIPSQDKKSALRNLRENPVETLDFHNEEASIAEWAKGHMEELAPRLSSVLGKMSGATGRDVSYWMGLLLEFVVRPPDDSARTSDLLETVFGSQSRFHSGAGFLGGLGSFLNLTTLIEPAVLVLDEVDGLSCDTDSALQATSSLVALWQSTPRASVIISVNDDVWDSAFAPKLPMGLLDRLEDVVVRLAPLALEEARSLIRIRSGKKSDDFLDQVDLGSGDLYPRAVLKAAREAWENREEVEETPAPAEKDKSSSVLKKSIEVIPFGATPPVEVLQKTNPPYPPSVVKRATLPKSFPVERIKFSKSTPPVPTGVGENEKGDFSTATEILGGKLNVGVLVEIDPPYPPFEVRRAALPKSFPVERIREAPAASTEFPNLSGKVIDPFEKPGPLDPSLVGPDLEPTAQASPFGTD